MMQHNFGTSLTLCNSLLLHKGEINLCQPCTPCHTHTNSQI